MPSCERRVLVIEDDALIAIDLCDALEQTGYRVAGPARTIQDAHLLLDEQTPTVAVVDIRLKDGPCTSIVRELRSRGVPFVVHSASRRDDAVADFLDAPWCPKPAWPHDLLVLLDALPQNAPVRPQAAG